MRLLIVHLAVLALMAGCRGEARNTQDQSLVVRADVHPTISSTFTTEPTIWPTVTPTATSTATPTPSPTPSPTPTAQPIAVSGNPRQATIEKQLPPDGTDCQVVDIFDFPLNPPDGDGVARGGSDFGVYRSRYEQFHTGEDWWTSRGSGSFGAPVYSIGNGRVTYAAPLGWGRDQGVVIIRHTFPDGRELLSFYGHLDPPSVTLTPGQCVSRGQQIGAIGRPRTPPHLHFEIRTHMPDEPGGGYWWRDPALDGWLPPSQTIWQIRMLASPGVVWLRTPRSQDSLAIGADDGQTFLILEDKQIIGIDAANGEERWSIAPEHRPESAALDATSPILYSADQLGRVEAFRLPQPAEALDPAEATDELESLWQVELDVVGNPQLIALPGGGIMMAVWDNVIGLSSAARVLWQNDNFGSLSDWLVTGDRLLLSTVGGEPSLWVVDQTGPSPWPNMNGGALAAQGNDVLLFNDEGLYRLNPDDGSSILLSDWPHDSLRASDVAGLQNGSALVLYLGRTDRRLIYFDAGGNVTWQRSLPDDVNGAPRLQSVLGKPFLVNFDTAGSSGTVSVYAIDVDSASLARIFDGGTRTPRASLNSVEQSDSGNFLLNIGGGHLISLDVKEAAVGTKAARTASTGSLPQ
jgi:murein DD-endopeptidase MepM/ murein hydrolase activator NlpD